MGRHALRRGGLTAAVSTLAVTATAITVLAQGPGGATAQAAPVAGAGTKEIALADPSTDTPRVDRPLTAGSTGFLHRQSGVDGLLPRTPTPRRGTATGCCPAPSPPGP